MDKKEALRNIIYNLKEIESTRIRLSSAKSENIDIELALLNQQILNTYRYIQNYHSGLYASQPIESTPVLQKEIPAVKESLPPVAEKTASSKEELNDSKLLEAELKRNKDAQLRKDRLKRLEAEMEKIEAAKQKEKPAPAPKGETEDFTKLVQQKIEEEEIAEEAAKVSGKEIQEHSHKLPGAEVTLNERLQIGNKAKETLNEKFAQHDTKKTIADKLKTTPITDLKSAMALNQKIAFTNALFGGDDKEFKKALNFLNNCTNFSEAKFYLQNELSKRYKWNESEPLVEEFTEIVYRKFL